MTKILTKLIILSLLIPTLAMASKPTDKVIKRVQASIEVLKTNPESEIDLNVIHKEVERIMHKYGMEGVAWLAYHNPVMLEAYIQPDSMGFENISISLLKQAETEDQMKEMIVALVSAQIRSNLDPFADENVAILKRGCKASSVNLELVDLDQMVSEALVMGAEIGGSEVQAATFDGSLLNLLIALKLKLIKLTYNIYVPTWEEVISPIR